MTLQQLQYLLALNRHRQFVLAAEECGVSQPTLSTMIAKLEEELGVPLFDRKKKPMEPTAAGAVVIRQAEKALQEINRIGEWFSQESGQVGGELRMAVLPTVAPYLVPPFIREFQGHYPQVSLRMMEMRRPLAIRSLLEGTIDVAVLSGSIPEDGLLEVPLYRETFYGYAAAPGNQETAGSAPAPADGTPVLQDAVWSLEQLPQQEMWILEEGHCDRKCIFSFCSGGGEHRRTYEAGTIDTLVRIVDCNGGYTIIPEMHLPFLTESQRSRIHPLDSPDARREVSLVFRQDYVREGMLNAIADTVKLIVPERLLDERLRRFRIRL